MDSEFPLSTPATAQPQPIAPLWHTIVLVAGILAFSIWGGIKATTNGGEPLSNPGAPRLVHYALTGALELLIVAWVALGLRLRRVPFRSLFGKLPRTLNAFFIEAAAAAIFWVASLAVLAAVGLIWNVGQYYLYHHQQQQASAHQPQPESPQQQRMRTVKQLMELAPATGTEMLAWAFLCLIVGTSEELIFRGYLQLQSIAVLRNLPAGVILSALVFGAAHGYEGTGAMIQIAVFGGLFSILTLLRRCLLPGIMAHAWHDCITGLCLAALRESKLLDRLPIPS